ncbi:hypothetical protein PABG_11842 [Paracoccidioides brasiliensis Pb03]|nr:hypothetical protein PABG_11842 [Paracoccidioides brasiliensis Pb03]
MHNAEKHEWDRDEVTLISVLLSGFAPCWSARLKDLHFLQRLNERTERVFDVAAAKPALAPQPLNDEDVALLKAHDPRNNMTLVSPSVSRVKLEKYVFVQESPSTQWLVSQQIHVLSNPRFARRGN